jgi:hypothetical protein
MTAGEVTAPPLVAVRVRTASPVDVASAVVVSPNAWYVAPEAAMPVAVDGAVDGAPEAKRVTVAEPVDSASVATTSALACRVRSIEPVAVASAVSVDPDAWCV